MTNLLSRKQVADRFGVCKHTVRNWERTHNLRRVDFTQRTIRYPASAVDELEQKLTFNPGIR